MFVLWIFECFGSAIGFVVSFFFLFFFFLFIYYEFRHNATDIPIFCFAPAAVGSNIMLYMLYYTSIYGADTQQNRCDTNVGRYINWAVSQKARKAKTAENRQRLRYLFLFIFIFFFSFLSNPIPPPSVILLLLYVSVSCACFGVAVMNLYSIL